MGDFSSPKRRDVFDRLRRRLELYRRHQNDCGNSYDNTINTIYEAQIQETRQLQKKWEETKAKKASKQSKASRDSSGNHGNLIVTQRLKRKLDGHQADHPTSGEGVDESEASTPKKVLNNSTATGFNVSVRIEHSQEPHNTNVNVNVHATVDRESASSVKTTTSVECKQEPNTENCKEAEGYPTSDIINPEELEALLDAIQDKDSDDKLLEELKKFDQIYQSKFSDDSSNSNDSKMYPGMSSVSPGLTKIESNSPRFDGNQNFNPVNSPPVPNYRTPSVTMSETLPAAETLKQLAAHHQHQNQGGPGYSPYMNQMPSDSSQFPSNMYPNYDQANQQPHYNSTQGQYLNSQNMNPMQGHVPFAQSKADPDLTYDGTKPLSHYQPVSSTVQQPPSSLQQLQNQVQTHFSHSQSPQMEITQTQHVQVTDGANLMKMSQTQQVQMRQPPQQMTLSQHQSFNVPGAMGPNGQNSQYMNEQMKMQMMQDIKMRRDEQNRARVLLESRRQQQQQQYMNRPPPEYKMQQSAPEGYPGANMGPNPLQTMQNMVNQTNSMSAQYSHIKSESASVQIPNGMMQSHQVTAMQQRVNSSHVPDMSQVSQPYQVSQLQRQQSYPGAQNHHRPQRHQPEPSYTSSIMRNQRPPNVNVGPDGLNISQPRSDWPRAMMNQPLPRQPMPPGMSQMNSQMNMMQYQYANQNSMGGMQGPSNRQMSGMQSQPIVPSQEQVRSHQMMMQQSMQMSQRMRGSGPPAMSGGHVDSNSQIPNGSSQDDIMNLLDSASQNNDPELLDSMTVQSSDANNDAAWLDEILGAK